MIFFIRVLLVTSIMSLSGLGLVFSAFAGDVIKPALKGQEDRLRKAGDPSPSEVAKKPEKSEAQPRRGPHDDQKDRFGRRLGPEGNQEERYGRQGGRYDGRDGRYGRKDGRYDGQDGPSGRRDQPYNEQGQNYDQRSSRYNKAPNSRPQGYERRLGSHFRSHFRRGESVHYQQAYRGTTSGRFRHYNNSRYGSVALPAAGIPRSPRSLPNRYKKGGNQGRK